MYDGDGYRVGTSFQGLLTHFYWDGDQISLETDASGQQIARNVYGLERIARILEPGSAAYALLSDQQGYYLYNGHGDVTSIWDIQGSLLNTYEYDPWGVVLEKTGMLDNPFQYSGEYQDTPGRQYLRARYYDANVGRFLTEDTYRGDTANPGSLNLYTYVANNPLRYADPSGHMPEWVNETIDAVNPLSDIMTLADPCASMFDKGLAVVSIAANFFPEAKPLTIAAKEARAAKRVAKILERSVKGAGKEDPYDLLKQFGIPSTLSKEEIHAANAVDLQMMYKGAGDGAWKPGMEVTEGHIREAMQNVPLQTQQGAVSLPAINRYTQRLSNGEVPPPIKVDNGIIVDGNHRYIAGRVAGVEIPVTPYSGGKPDNAIKWENMNIDPFDWGNK